MMKNITTTRLILIFIAILNTSLKSQDLIIKTNGDSIKAKITEVGTIGISFKKTDFPDGPTFVVSKSEILMVKYSNGKTEQFNAAITTNTMSAGSFTNGINSGTNSVITNSNSAIPGTLSGNQQTDSKTKIEMIDSKKFTINGQKASRKEVDKLLGKSKNPAILVPLKAAKMTKTAQKIVKLTSIPTSIGGGFSTLVTGIDMYNDIRRRRDNTQTYTNALMSLVGTLTLPITNKILKNKSDKMYEKLIDMYNLTN